MGKAARHRVRSRINFLSELLESDPERFRREWAKRMPAKVHDIKRHANRLVDGFGKPTPSPFIVMEKAVNELKLIGKKAVKLEGASTGEALTAECTRALGRLVNPRALRRV